MDLGLLGHGDLRVDEQPDGARESRAFRRFRQPLHADRARHAAAQGITLMDKSVAAATESSLAMKSRGAFDA